MQSSPISVAVIERRLTACESSWRNRWPSCRPATIALSRSGVGQCFEWGRAVLGEPTGLPYQVDGHLSHLAGSVLIIDPGLTMHRGHDIWRPLVRRTLFVSDLDSLMWIRQPMSPAQISKSHELVD
jgi:hypothetical protein